MDNLRHIWNVSVNWSLIMWWKQYRLHVNDGCDSCIKGREIDEKNNIGCVYFRGVRWPGRHDFVSLEQHEGMKLMPTRFKPLASCHYPRYEAGTFSCLVTRVDAFAGRSPSCQHSRRAGAQFVMPSKDCHRLKVNNGATFFTRFSINFWQTSSGSR